MTSKHETGSRKDTGEPTASTKSAEAKVEAKPEDKAEVTTSEQRPRGVMAFARRHPVATVVGAAGIGLFGGVEIAAAMLVGAGVAAIVGRDHAEPRAHVVRDRARSFLAKKPEIKNRARAVVDAVRGRAHPNGHNA